jgi:condensin complex subunit 2
VDDTHASSRNILESLSRTYTVDNGAEGQERGTARVGTKSASNKLNIANTIASDVDSINAAKIERVQATDPMFHKMSKAFDDGGAKGMLMNNLVG